MRVSTGAPDDGGGGRLLAVRLAALAPGDAEEEGEGVEVGLEVVEDGRAVAQDAVTAEQRLCAATWTSDSRRSRQQGAGAVCGLCSGVVHHATETLAAGWLTCSSSSQKDT